jgi:hypothetical protein
MAVEVRHTRLVEAAHHRQEAGLVRGDLEVGDTEQERLIAFVEGSSFQLIEALAERCAALIREEFGVSWLRLKLSKPGAVRGARSVGVVIERGQRN